MAAGKRQLALLFHGGNVEPGECGTLGKRSLSRGADVGAAEQAGHRRGDRRGDKGLDHMQEGGPGPRRVGRDQHRVLVDEGQALGLVHRPDAIAVAESAGKAENSRLGEG